MCLSIHCILPYSSLLYFYREKFGDKHPKYSDTLLDYGFYLLSIDWIHQAVEVGHIGYMWLQFNITNFNLFKSFSWHSLVTMRCKCFIVQLLLLFAFQSMFISICVSRLEIAEFPDSVRRSAS